MAREFASDEHLDYVAALLDDMFRIPGTGIRFGLDALIGWVPGVGDAMTGIASFLIVFASWKRGAKSITLVRMIANVLLETAVGSIPVVGDAFHVVWKANRRNYRLLMRERWEPGVHVRRDWMFLGVLLFAVILAVAIPIAILIWLLGRPIAMPRLVNELIAKQIAGMIGCATASVLGFLVYGEADWGAVERARIEL